MPSPSVPFGSASPSSNPDPPPDMTSELCHCRASTSAGRKLQRPVSSFGRGATTSFATPQQLHAPTTPPLGKCANRQRVRIHLRRTAELAGRSETTQLARNPAPTPPGEPFNMPRALGMYRRSFLALVRLQRLRTGANPATTPPCCSISLYLVADLRSTSSGTLCYHGSIIATTRNWYNSGLTQRSGAAGSANVTQLFVRARQHGSWCRVMRMTVSSCRSSPTPYTSQPVRRRQFLLPERRRRWYILKSHYLTPTAWGDGPTRRVAV